MTNQDDDVGIEDAKESGKNLIRYLKQFTSNLALLIRNSINRRHWLIRGGIKALLAGLFFQLIVNSLRYLARLNIQINRIVRDSYRFIIAFLPSIQIEQSRMLIFFIGLFIVVESIQLRRLSRIERIVVNRMEPQPDGGREVKADSENSSSGVGGGIGGAIAGGALGSAFGPQGAILGAIAGAAFGSELEKSQTPKNSAEIRCAILNTLIRQHAWSQTIPKEVAIRKAVAPENRKQASEVWEGLGYESFILASQRGYRLDQSNMDQLASYLRENCGWSERRIQAEFPHYE